jgi:valyl-tRNA synthetase
VVTSHWPQSDRRALDQAALRDFGLVQELVSAIRTIRAEYKVPPGQSVSVWVSNQHPAIETERATVERLSKARLKFGDAPNGAGGHAVLTDGSQVFVALEGVIDLGQECARLREEANRLRALVANQVKKLGNEQFVSRAPAEVVAKEREKLQSWSEQVRALDEKLALLGCG